MQTSYSVLMSVYRKETPNNLSRALNSIWSQTIPSNEVVLVCDGPVGDALESVIVQEERKHPELVVVRLEQNMGLGISLNAGMDRCHNDLIMRADSDDISLPNRAEMQLKVFEDNQCDIVSSYVSLFDGDPKRIHGSRQVPLTHEKILKFSKIRNPFNHPAVMFRKEAVLRAGGYQHMAYSEDYYLWIRMLHTGAIGANIETPLVLMQENRNTIERRSSKEAYLGHKALFKYMRSIRYIGPVRYRTSVMMAWLRFKLPKRMVRFIYKTLLRG